MRAYPARRRYAFIVAAAALSACTRAKPAPAPADAAADSTPAATASAMTTLTPEERSEGWRLLFDGTSLDGWRGYQADTVPTGWSAADGELVKTGSTEDLVSREQFGDFELAWDWQLPPGGNAGLFYRATEQYDHIYWSGPEYQLLDDAGHPDGQNRLTAAGAAYGLYPAPAGVVHPAGEWNSSRIVVRGAHVEHWLNGTRLLQYELWSPDWQAKVAASKFSKWPAYGQAKRGLIGFQGDHDGTLRLRRIRVKE